jgi:PAS domain S-box-containing protein
MLISWANNLHNDKGLSVASVELVWLEQNRARVLAASAAITLLIVIVDLCTTLYVSMGLLYLFPVIFAAGFLPRWVIGLIGIACAFLSEQLEPLEHSSLRMSLTALAVAGCGLFVSEAARQRRQSAAFQTQWRLLVQMSPAAVVSLDTNGLLDYANDTAVQLLGPRDGRLLGHPIAAFLPDLHHAVCGKDEPLHAWTQTQCRGRKANGDDFEANIWSSSYEHKKQRKIVAMILDAKVAADALPKSAEEYASPVAAEARLASDLSARELRVLRLLAQGLTNRQIATELNISESAVKNAMQQLFFKNGVRNRTQLVRLALENGAAGVQSNG